MVVEAAVGVEVVEEGLVPSAPEEGQVPHLARGRRRESEGKDLGGRGKVVGREEDREEGRYPTWRAASGTTANQFIRTPRSYRCVYGSVFV